MVEVVRVFRYFSCFPHDVGTFGLDVGCDLCSVKVDAVFGCCRMFGYHWSLVLQSYVSDMFRNPGGDVTACLADISCTIKIDTAFVLVSLK
jgi:hypothetical protein